jgi:hypothetical protein
VGCAKIIYGHDLLNEAAMTAVKKWTFRPLLIKGKAVPVVGIVGVFVSWNTEKMREYCKK